MSLTDAIEAAAATGQLHWMQGPVAVPACCALGDAMGTGDQARVTCPVCLRIMANDAPGAGWQVVLTITDPSREIIEMHAKYLRDTYLGPGNPDLTGSPGVTVEVRSIPDEEVLR